MERDGLIRVYLDRLIVDVVYSILNLHGSATGLLQQHLRLHIRSLTTFQQALDIAYAYTKSKHLAVLIIAHASSQGSAPMDIGGLKGKGKSKGKGWKEKRNERNVQRQENR